MTTVYSFNLLDEAFIPVIDRTGIHAEVSLKDAILKSTEWVEIQDGSPLVVASLHRFLLAVVHGALRGPKSVAERIALLNEGKFPEGIFADYFKKWHKKFDIFDPTAPFYQSKDFTAPDPGGINRLAQELARGNNPVLFDHTVEERPPEFTPAKCARLLIAEQTFAMSAGKSFLGHTKDAPWSRAAIVLAHGQTLFETLWLNLLPYDGDSLPIPNEPTDKPVWERDPEKPSEATSVCSGYLDYLTWQSRTINLHLPPEHGGPLYVDKVSYAQGRTLVLPENFQDPMIAYLRNEKTGQSSLRLNEDRDFWRNSSALFQFAQPDKGNGPKVLAQLSPLIQRKVIDRSNRYRLKVFGMCTDQAKVNFWRQESLPLPLDLLKDQGLVEILKEILELTDRVAREALIPAVKHAVSVILNPVAPLKADSGRVENYINNLGTTRAYWSDLEIPFRLFLETIQSGADKETVLHHWFWKSIHPQAIKAYKNTVERLNSPKTFRGMVEGKRRLMLKLGQTRSQFKIETQKEKEPV